MADRIEKQLETIQVLIRDKTELSQQIEQLAKSAKEREVVVEKLRVDEQEKFKRELRREREAWMAAEKVKREKWEAEKAKEIKEGTVSALYPTIESIIEKHKGAVEKLKEDHAVDIRKKCQLIKEEAEKAVQELREKLLKEKEESLEKERAKL